MAYVLGKRSRNELVGVSPNLVLCVAHAIEISAVDFSVHDGLRTQQEQEEYLRAGVTKLAYSKHMKQADGLGHAVDLVPYINGKLRWELDACCKIAEAMRRAAEYNHVDIRWGGGWCKLNGTKGDPMDLVDAYVDRKRREGKRAFIDGPHFELL